ncbi:MAG: hypothetical protein U9N14_07615 [Pseudomonadota bacterium]|nr:hypothetical protein [Pseudomonadota bacterium]
MTGRAITLLAPFVIGLACGFVLVTLAAPRLARAVAVGDAHHVAVDLSEKKTPSPERIDTAIATMEKQAERYADAKNAADLAALRMFRAHGPDITPSERDRLLDLSCDATIASLTMQPAAPYGWARLAALTDRHNGPADLIREAAEMSLLTGHFAENLLVMRLKILVDAWNALDKRIKADVLEQIRLADRHRKWELYNATTDNIQLARLTRIALATDHRRRDFFERWYARHERK